MSHTNKNVVTKQLASKKWLIYTSLGLSLLINLVAFSSLLIGGMFGVHAYALIALVLIDAVLLLSSKKTNFRFSYGKTLPLILTFVKLGLVAFITFGISWYTFSTTALIALVVSQLASALALIVCVIDASNRGIGLSVFAFITAILLGASSVLFIGNTLSVGLFGQGRVNYRAITYSYLSDSDSYRVNGIVDGFGDKIIIPEQFNGKPITEIDSKILEGINEVDLNTSSACFSISSSNVIQNDDLIIYVTKDKVDEFKNSLVSKMTTTSSSKTALSLINAITPKDLSEDEVFVTFSYTQNNFTKADKQLLSTWYGKKGDVFDVSEYNKDIEYAKDYDLADENYLFKCYQKGIDVLSPLTFDGKNIQNTKIEKSISKLNVGFEKVLKVTVGEDNDTKYEPSNSFKTFGGTDYRFVVKSDETNLLQQISQRTGFTLSWQYANDGAKKSFTSLSAILENGDVTIYPKWELLAPTVSDLTIDNQNIIYGDDFAVSTTATHLLPSINLDYKWTFGDITDDGANNTLSVTNANPVQSGECKLVVTASNQNFTSLTRTVTKTINVKINKKELGFNWDLPNGIYSGEDKTITCNYDSSDVINGDAITFDVNDNVCKDVGTYTANVSLNDACAELYTIKTASKRQSFTITPYPLVINWITEDFVYNGSFQSPKVQTINGVSGDGEIGITVSGGKKAAGENYTATASSNNKNYTISNSTQTFSIAKKSISAVWSNIALTYNGKAQKPTATLNGVISPDSVSVSVSGEQINAGDNYLAMASITNGNYKLVSGVSQSFTIAKKSLSVSWSNTSLTYNGKAQKPTATLNGVVSPDSVSVSVSGEQVNAGSNYTATASIKSDNYQLSSGTTQTFVINKKSLSVIWSNTTLVYNGNAQKPTATLNGVLGSDVVSVSVSGEQTNAGEGYTATAQVDHENYFVSSNLETTFIIMQKELSVTFVNTEATLIDGTFTEDWITLSDDVDNESASVSYVYYQNETALTQTPSEVGEYQLHVLIGNNNFVLIGETTCTITIKEDIKNA